MYSMDVTEAPFAATPVGSSDTTTRWWPRYGWVVGLVSVAAGALILYATLKEKRA